MQLFSSLWWDGAQDCFMGLRGGGGGVEKHCTRASLRSDSGSSDKTQCRRAKSGRCLMLESVVSWFSRGQRSRRPNYRSWPSEGHVTAMEDSP